MPFDAASHGAPSPLRIAVVGAGVSGLSAAYFLSRRHHVTLYEAQPRLGGHARTIMAGRDRATPVDTGFMVFNRRNYPLLNALFEELDVPTKPCPMSFAVSLDGGALEYGLHDPARLFADPANIARPAFWRLLGEILRFNAQAGAYADREDLTIGAMLEELALSDAFRALYLTPLTGAIWSSPTEEMLRFPAASLVRFFRNHALLSALDNPRWYTVDGGSRAYVERLAALLARRGCVLRAGAPVRGVSRVPGGVRLKADGGPVERYDHVVLACHSDEALALLADARPDEREVLGALRYRPNRVVLHRDPSRMPRRRAAWSCWVHQGETRLGAPNDSFTYWMNLLQSLPKDEPFFVTLNPYTPIPDELVYDETVLSHPVFDLAALSAQRRLSDLQGVGNTWLCGAYARFGFHEDGIASAADVAARVDAAAALPGMAA